MPYNLVLKLKKEPVFDIKKDVEAMRADKTGVMSGAFDKGVAAMPHPRVYICAGYEPVAIFGVLPPEELGVFIKLALCVSPKIMPEMDEYADGRLMNAYKKADLERGIEKPFRLACFVADRLLYHALIPVDLMVNLCVRFNSYDIIDRGFWDFVTRQEQ